MCFVIPLSSLAQLLANFFDKKRSRIVMPNPLLTVFFPFVCPDGCGNVLPCRVHHPGDDLQQEHRASSS